MLIRLGILLRGDLCLRCFIFCVGLCCGRRYLSLRFQSFSFATSRTYLGKSCRMASIKKSVVSHHLQTTLLQQVYAAIPDLPVPNQVSTCFHHLRGFSGSPLPSDSSCKLVTFNFIRLLILTPKGFPKC